MSRTLITVKTLIAQSRRDGAIELPADALITPAAADWLAATRLSIARLDRPDPAEATDRRQPTVYLIGDAAHPNIRTLLPIWERRYGGVAFHPCRGHRVGLLEAVATTCRALAECSCRRAVVVIKNVALVNCLANKHAGVRAAIAPRPSALHGLVAELGINMLLIENERMSLSQVQAVVDRFLSAKTTIDPLVEAALNGDRGQLDGGSEAAGCVAGVGHAHR
ncbi:MAG: hypothetical protein GY778_04025 [bacterium]|nr:hypothetical protein [bacterium]